MSSNPRRGHRLDAQLKEFNTAFEQLREPMQRVVAAATEAAATLATLVPPPPLTRWQRLGRRIDRWSGRICDRPDCGEPQCREARRRP